MNKKREKSEEWLKIYSHNGEDHNLCVYRAPCNNTCCLDPEVDHHYHSCGRPHCKLCHGRDRFQRRQ